MLLCKYSVIRVFSVFEREFVIVVSCFEFVLCHSTVSACITGGCCDCSFIDNVGCETFSIKRAKSFISAIAKNCTFAIFFCNCTFLLFLLLSSRALYVSRVLPKMEKQLFDNSMKNIPIFQKTLIRTVYMYLGKKKTSSKGCDGRRSSFLIRNLNFILLISIVKNLY